MPVLEAWQNNTVAIGGRGTVLEEVIGDPKYLFDVLSPSSMAEKLELLLVDEKAWKMELERVKLRREQFTWGEVAKRLSVVISRYLK